MAMWQRASSPFGDVTGEAFEYLETSYQNVTANLSGAFGEMVFKAQENIRDHRAFRLAVAAGRKLRYSGTTNEIRELFTCGEIQNAPAIMQALIVAMPEYRTLYNEGMAEGFANGFSVFDTFRGSAHMQTDQNFRIVTNGLTTVYDEDNLWNYTTPIHLTEQFSVADQIDVMKVWARMHKLDWDDEDPCSENNAACG